MPRSKRPRIVLFLAVAMVAIFGCAAVAMKFIQRNPVLLVPEKHDPAFQMAQRESPDNAWFALQDAEAALPEVPEGIAPALDAEVFDLEIMWREFASGPLDYLGVTAANAPSAMLLYLLRCGPAAEKLHEALAKPYFLRKQPPTRLSAKDPKDFHRLALTLLGYGAVLLHAPETQQQGFGVLIDCMKLARWLWRESGEQLHESGIEEKAWRILEIAVQRPQALPHLEWLQQQLQLIGPPFADREGLLQQYWIALDNSLTYRPPFYNPWERMGNVRRARDIGLRNSLWLPVRDTLKKLASTAPTDAVNLLLGDPAAAAVYNREEARLYYNVFVLRYAAYQDFYYWRTLGLISLLRHKAQAGAYPAQLEQLVPAYLAEVPKDTLSLQPIKYTSDGQTVQAYGLGLNGADEAGGGDDLPFVRLP